MRKWWWGKSCVDGAIVILIYEWVYKSLCIHVSGVEPWNPTWYAAGIFGIGVVLNIMQKLLELSPPKAAPSGS